MKKETDVNENNSTKSVIAAMVVASVMTALLLGPGCSRAKATPELASYAGKKILYINSYHEGYEWSDGITDAIRNTLYDTGVELRIHTMDTKRNPDQAFKERAGLEAKAVIEAFNPDVVITSDDNAFKYVVMPYYRDADLAFVYCGINWDALVYGAPYRNTTGMLEVTLLEQLVEELKNYADGDRIGYLVMESSTGRKEGEYFSKVLHTSDIRYVNSFSEWKRAFVDMQATLDMLVIGNFRGITGLDEKEAQEFVRETIKIPVGADHEPEMPYAMIGFVTIAEEQGAWAAQTALRILNGTHPLDIPEVTNKQAQVLVNLALADKLDIIFPPSILKIAEIYEPDGSQ